MIIIKLIVLMVGLMTGGVLAYGAWRFNAEAMARPDRSQSKTPQRSVSLSSMRRLRSRASSVLAGSSG
jgi:hypothetical protein